MSEVKLSSNPDVKKKSGQRGRSIPKTVSTPKHKKAIAEVIKHFGNCNEVAKSLQITAQPVYSWLSGHSVIPVLRAEELQKLTKKKFTVLQLRPDLEKYRKYFK